MTDAELDALYAKAQDGDATIEELNRLVAALVNSLRIQIGRINELENDKRP